jgi:hypothetical protein
MGCQPDDTERGVRVGRARFVVFDHQDDEIRRVASMTEPAAALCANARYDIDTFHVRTRGSPRHLRDHT